jgi:hypothetical protein
VQTFEAHEFDVIAKQAGTAGFTRASMHHAVWRRGRIVLGTGRTDADEQRGR